MVGSVARKSCGRTERPSAAMASRGARVRVRSAKSKTMPGRMQIVSVDARIGWTSDGEASNSVSASGRRGAGTSTRTSARAEPTATMIVEVQEWDAELERQSAEEHEKDPPKR